MRINRCSKETKKDFVCLCGCDSLNECTCEILSGETIENLLFQEVGRKDFNEEK